MDEENEGLEMESRISGDEQSAAWREVAREGIDAANRIAWLAWSYLMIRLSVEFTTVWIR